MYLHENRPAFMLKYPNTRSSELAKLMAESYNKLSEEEKNALREHTLQHNKTQSLNKDIENMGLGEQNQEEVENPEVDEEEVEEELRRPHQHAVS